MSSCKLKVCSLSTGHSCHNNHSRALLGQAAGEAGIASDCSVVSTEEVAHVDVGLFFFLFLLFGLGLGGSGGGSRGTSSGEGGSSSLKLVSLREGVVGGEGHGGEVL